MIQITDKSKCCGCTACYSVCPKKCITMKPDFEGFLYPEVNLERCVDCHACEKVCPIRSHKFIEHDQSTLLGVQYADTEKRLSSTAGGAFSLIADYLIDSGAIVYAVGYDNDCVVCHKAVGNKKELEELRGSKYVQSRMGDTYREIKKHLKVGTKVLFVGTPCQVHGLINCVGDNVNLYTIDLLCLGVSSPSLFSEYTAWIEKKYGSRVTQVLFRNKHFGYATPNIRVCLENGKYIQQSYDSRVHANLFFKKYYNTRPSCYQCEYREIPRVSDFTIGDFTNIGQFSKSMDDDKGTTKMWVHSNKGILLLDALSDRAKTIVLDDSGINIVGGPKQQISRPERRKEFFEDVQRLSYSELINKWEPKKVKDELIGITRRILYYMPGHKSLFRIMREYKRKKYVKNVQALNGEKNV